MNTITSFNPLLYSSIPRLITYLSHRLFSYVCMWNALSLCSFFLHPHLGGLTKSLSMSNLSFLVWSSPTPLAAVKCVGCEEGGAVQTATLYVCSESASDFSLLTDAHSSFSPFSLSLSLSLSLFPLSLFSDDRVWSLLWPHSHCLRRPLSYLSIAQALTTTLFFATPLSLTFHGLVGATSLLLIHQSMYPLR